MRAIMKSLVVLLVLVFGVAARVNADDYDKIAKVISKGANELKNKKIAVLPFPYHDGGTSSGSTEISERLTTRLVGKNGVVVIERSLLNKVFDEMKLENTGAVDPDTAKQLGKVLGVEAIVTGTLIDLSEEKTEVNARLIKTETGEVFAACTREVERTWKDSPRKPSVKNTAAQPETAQPEAVSGQRAQTAQNRRQEALDLFNMAGTFEERNAVAEARNLYWMIVNHYPGQKDIVGQAQNKLDEMRAVKGRGNQTGQNRRQEALELFNAAGTFEERNAVAEARNLYWMIINYYPRQKDIIAQARNRLANLK